MQPIHPSHPRSGSHPLPVWKWKSQQSPQKPWLVIQGISYSSGPCPSRLSLDSAFSSFSIHLQLISVRSHPHSVLGDAHERTPETQLCARFLCPQRVAYSKSPTCHLICDQMVADSGLCTSGSSSKVMLETVLQPKPFNTAPATHLEALAVVAWPQAVLQPVDPATSPPFLFPSKTRTVQPLPS